MEEGKTYDSHLTSAAAFVEGGIQDPCDDACSICLEVFCDSEPSTLTTCKHEFHLQCILEWCQRSSQCPMCWQSVSLKDPGSQELLDAVENERNIRMNPPRNTTIFHHPTLGDFELQHLPISATESELEERIIQHLAAAAAMGRARQHARREGQRGRSAAQGRPHFLVFSTNPSGASGSPTNSSGASGSPTNPVLPRDTSGPVVLERPNSQFLSIGEDYEQVIGRPASAQFDQLVPLPPGEVAGRNQHMTPSTNRRSPTPSSPGNQNRAGPSDFQTFSDNVKSRFSALSTRYKDSITKSTRGWKERLFARNSASENPIAESRRVVDQHSSAVRMMDHLQLVEDSGSDIVDASHNPEDRIPERQTVHTGGATSTPLN